MRSFAIRSIQLSRSRVFARKLSVIARVRSSTLAEFDRIPQHLPYVNAMAMGMEKLTQPVIGKIFQAGDKLIGQSGREYRVEQVLQARKYVQVHLARSV